MRTVFNVTAFGASNRVARQLNVLGYGLETAQACVGCVEARTTAPAAAFSHQQTKMRVFIVFPGVQLATYW